MLLSLVPESLAELLPIPHSESFSEWSRGSMWGFMILYVFLSYLYGNFTDDDDLKNENIYAIIGLFLLPGQLFVVSVWPILKKFRLVKSEHNLRL